MTTLKDMTDALTCCELMDTEDCDHCPYWSEGDNCHYKLMCDIALYLTNLMRG